MRSAVARKSGTRPNICLVFAACLLVNQASQVFAQSVNSTQATIPTNYNTMEWSQISSNELTAIVKNADPSRIPANAWGVILKRVDWFQLPANVQNYVSDNVDWSLVPTNIIEYYNQPVAWPNSRQALKHCAELMRSSVDTNWLAMITSKLTNQPAVFQFTNRLNDGTETVMLVTNADIKLYFEAFSKRLVSTLDEYADYLDNPKLNAYLGEAGYGAEIPSPRQNEGMIYFGFQSENGPTSDFRQIVNGVSRARVAAGFDKNGKLGFFEVIMPEHQESAHFVENGQLKDIGWRMNDHFSIQFKLDESGNSHAGGYFRKVTASQK